MEREAQMEAEFLAAVRRNDLALMRECLASLTCRPNLPREGQTTALMLAAAAGHVEMVALLLQHGADPARRDASGRSAADHAQANGHGDLAQQLATDGRMEQVLR
jgi:ankyrin repeat protein